MQTIKHQFVSLHEYGVIALTGDKYIRDETFNLQQRDGSLIPVQRVNGGVWAFSPKDLPQTLTLVLYGVTAETLLKRLKQLNPAYFEEDHSGKIIYFVAVKRL